MALPQIGLEAILKLNKFIQDADKYNRTLDMMNKKTAQVARDIESSTQRAASSSQNLVKGATDQASAATQASSANAAFSLSLQKVAVASAIAVGGIGGVIKAMDALLEAGEQAAAIDETRKTFQAMAASYGLSANEIVAGLQRVSRGTLDTVTIMQVANQAMLAGGKEMAQALPQLFQIAEGSARASGKNALDVFETLIRGIAKGSPKLIDDAEVYLLIADAVEQYARSTNRTVDELTAFERQQATLQAVLAQGSDFLERMGYGAELATDPFRQLEIQTGSFADGLKTIFLPAATSVAERLQAWVPAAKAAVASIAGLSAIFLRQGEIFRGEVGVWEVYQQRFDEVFQTLTTGTKPIEDVGKEIERVGEISLATAKRIDEINEKLRDLEAEYQDKLDKINLQNERRLEDMGRNRIRQTEDDELSLARRLEDMALRNARAREDIARENAKRLESVNDDLYRKQRDLDREAQLAREELERRHQDNLAKIKRESWDDVTEAARRNDAVAIARAIRQRQVDIREENIAYKIRQRELEIDLAEKQRKLDEDALLEKQKFQQQIDDRLAMQMLAEQRALEDLDIYLRRQREDRKTSWDRQLEDQGIAYQRQLDDLNAWYAKEKAALEAHLADLRQTAINEVASAAAGIAQAAASAISESAGSTYGLTAAEQWRNRHEYLGSETTPSSLGLSPMEQWRRRHSYFRAEGGMDVVNRPTHFVAGEAGPELAAFVPLRNNRLDIGGSVGVNVNGAGGMDTSVVQAMVYQAMVQIAQRLSAVR